MARNAKTGSTGSDSGNHETSSSESSNVPSGHGLSWKKMNKPFSWRLVYNNAYVMRLSYAVNYNRWAMHTIDYDEILPDAFNSMDSELDLALAQDAALILYSRYLMRLSTQVLDFYVGK